MSDKNLTLDSYSDKQTDKQTTNKIDNKTDSKPSKHETHAHKMAEKQRNIGVAEFFSRNRHLLGFDNKKKALMTTIKEAVDNSLDACEEARILPEVAVEVIDMGKERFRVIVEDNGPGIVKKQIPNIFARLLYGSKFHSLKQSRGQQGIGISASVMYAQLTTGRAAKITSRIDPKKPAMFYKLKMDTTHNKPLIKNEHEVEWHKEHGTRIELDLEASYSGGNQSIDEYLKETAIANPHVTIIYTNPKANQIIFPRAVDQLPAESKEIKPHPLGIEIGIMSKMLKTTSAKTLQQFLTTEFCRVGAGTAKTICEHAALLPRTKPKTLTRDQTEKLMHGIKKTKLIAPPTDCISPIGADRLEKGLRKEINAEFYCSTTRPPSVYRGNPFQIEVGMAYGGEQPGDKPARLLRFANRVPLLYQQAAGAAFKSIVQTSFRNYGLPQSKGALPLGPLTIAVHIASVWVPFTSESKEAIAQYPEILKEMKLAIQEAGRKLGMYVKKKKRIKAESQKRSYIETFIPHVSEALIELTGVKETEKIVIEDRLRDILEKTRGKAEEIKIDNPDYDPEFAKIGKSDPESESEEGGEDDE